MIYSSEFDKFRRASLQEFDTCVSRQPPSALSLPLFVARCKSVLVYPLEARRIGYNWRRRFFVVFVVGAAVEPTMLMWLRAELASRSANERSMMMYCEASLYVMLCYVKLAARRGAKEARSARARRRRRRLRSCGLAAGWLRAAPLLLLLARRRAGAPVGAPSALGRSRAPSRIAATRSESPWRPAAGWLAAGLLWRSGSERAPRSRARAPTSCRIESSSSSTTTIVGRRREKAPSGSRRQPGEPSHPASRPARQTDS